MRKFISTLTFMALLASATATTTPKDLTERFVALEKKSEILNDMTLSLGQNDSLYATTAKGQCNSISLAVFMLAGHLATVDTSPIENYEHFNNSCKALASFSKSIIEHLNKGIALAKSPGLVAELRDIRKLLEETVTLVESAQKLQKENK